MFVSKVNLVLLCVAFVACNKICDYNDEECTTRGATSNFRLFINGIKDKVPTSDPLFRSKIIGDLPNVKYDLTNATMSGMKNCIVMKLIIKTADQSFYYHIKCPLVVIGADYKIKGNVVEAASIEGEGYVTVTCEDYNYIFSGNYVKEVGADNEPHVQVKDYKVDVEAKGKVMFDFQNLFGGDKEKSEKAHKIINENWKKTDNAIRTPLMNSFMELFMNNLNAFLKIVPVKTALGLGDD